MREDVGQLLWIGFEGQTVPTDVRARLDAGRAGATVLFKRNLVYSRDGAGPELCDLDALEALVRELHRAAPDGAPALVTVDQEGGLVQRVREPATRWPPMFAHDGLPVGEDAAVAEAVGRALGDELRALGFDVDFAPVLDVHTNAQNPVIGERAFGRDAETVTRRALAFARGLDAAGVIACGKHFPGHGDTDTDSHLELPRVDHDWDRLERVELEPFRRAAAAGLPMIMTAHVVFAALDRERPATLSPAVVGGLLRERLGFRGVVVSDDLDMKAISAHFGADHAAVAAVRAGCDVLLLCRDEHNQALAEEALVREGERDPELRRRIAESAARVRELKRAHAAKLARLPAVSRDVVGNLEHRRLADRLAGRA
ncbi:MAG TPA: beta-N-acetylhexosaminidase [Kofleriaceae bacterium]|nr:beta-N-acetylhexosaminidase [Kofleriaceae bacterium]